MAFRIVPNFSKPKKNGEVPLVVFITMGKKQKEIRSGINALPEDYTILKDGRTYLKKTHGKSSYINKEIKRLHFELEKLDFEKAYKGIGEFKVQAERIIKGDNYINLTDVLTLEEAIRLYLSESGNKDSTIDSARSKLNKFRSFCSENGILYITEVNVDTMQEYKQEMLDEGNANSTINRDIRYVNTLFTWLNEKGNKEKWNYDILPGNIINPGTLKTIPNPVIFLKDDEISIIETSIVSDKLIQCKSLLLFQLYTGQRIKDVMDFNHNDIVDGYWVFTQSKTNKLMRLKLHDRLIEVLSSYNDANPINSIREQTFNSNLKDLLKELKIDRLVQTIKLSGSTAVREQVPIHQVFSSHHLRKTFITHSLSQGIPINEVMEWSGHRSVKSMEPYITADNDKANESIGRIWSKS